MASDHIRASDHDRDAVVGALRDAYTEGRLSLEEFQERTTAAYAGRTWGDLRELTTDLPVQPVLGADLPEGALPREALQDAPDADPAQPGAEPPYSDHPPLSGRPVYPGQPPYPFQLPGNGQPPQPGRPLQQGQQGRPPQRGRSIGPFLPLVGMWVLFAALVRTDGGAIVFLIAVVVLVVLASAGRRGGRGR